MPDTPSPTAGALLHNLILFGRLLRGLGMDVNPGRMIDLVQALTHVAIGRRADFYHTARCLLVHRREDLPIFDYAFDLFWQAPDQIAVPLDWPFAPPPDTPQNLITPPLLALPDAEPPRPNPPDDEADALLEITRTYSQRELLQNKDFSQMTAVEIDMVKQFMAQLVWTLGLRRTRRKRTGPRGRSPDLRRAFRQNLRYGGELLEWPRREVKWKPRPLIIIADVSGSMEQYTRLLLYFLYSLAQGLSQDVEAFVFSTRLTRITRQLRRRRLSQALNEVSQEVTDWSGGTRIGESIKKFNFTWGRRVLGRGAVVLIISDGWDRGDPALLHAEMGRLHRSCYRLIWLNPLLGSARYEPLTRGMQAALPHIDDFLPVHNLASLSDLADHLQSLTLGKRPSRPAQKSLTGAAFMGKR